MQKFSPALMTVMETDHGPAPRKVQGSPNKIRHCDVRPARPPPLRVVSELVDNLNREPDRITEEHRRMDIWIIWEGVAYSVIDSKHEPGVFRQIGREGGRIIMSI